MEFNPLSSTVALTLVLLGVHYTVYNKLVAKNKMPVNDKACCRRCSTRLKIHFLGFN